MALDSNFTTDDLKKFLKGRINQYEMLTNSLLEVFDKNPLSDSINDIRAAINETTEDIKNIQKLINEKENEKVKYSFYDAIKKPVEETTAKKVSMFDIIRKDKSGNDISKKNNEVINFLNTTTDCKENLDYCENIIMANNFLVRFSGLDVEEWLVKNVGYLSQNQLGITILDNVVNGRPIIADINSLINNDRKIGIIIDHLDKAGKVIYSERFHDCRIYNQIRNDLDYENDEFSTITMMVSFKEVTYETAH